MTQIASNTLAALAALLIATATLVPVVTVPPADFANSHAPVFA